MLLTVLAAQEDYFKVWGHVFLKTKCSTAVILKVNKKKHSFLVNRFTTIQ